MTWRPIGVASDDTFAVVSTDHGARYVVVPALDRVLWTESTALAAIASSLLDLQSGETLRQLGARLGAASGDDREIARVLVAALVDGTLLAFADQPFTPGGRPITRSDKPAPRLPRTSGQPRGAGGATGPAVEPGTAWVSFELLDENGAPLGDRDITFEHADGRLDSVALDGAGRSPRITTGVGASIHIEWPKRIETSSRAFHRDGFTLRADDIRISNEPGASTRLGPNRHWRIIVAVPRVTCVRLVGMLFELNKSFLLPAATEGTRLLEHMYRSMPDAQILAVGHTDRTGKKFRNDSLSLERAEAVVAYARDDVDRWLANYDSTMDASRRWGRGEDLLMLSCLPRGNTPYYSAEHPEHSFEAATRRLQEAHGLVVDGDLGPVSRRALVGEYMALDGTSVPASAKFVAHGCGEHFPQIPTEDEVALLR